MTAKQGRSADQGLSRSQDTICSHLFCMYVHAFVCEGGHDNVCGIWRISQMLVLPFQSV